jgi:hypothetical protein
MIDRTKLDCTYVQVMIDRTESVITTPCVSPGCIGKFD